MEDDLLDKLGKAVIQANACLRSTPSRAEIEMAIDILDEAEELYLNDQHPADAEDK